MTALRYFAVMSTLYINGLNERVKLPRLKLTLLKQFSHFGPVIQVTAHRNLKMRGQAFVAFKDEETASKALAMNGRRLYKKTINVAVAKTQSDEYHRLTNNLAKVEERKAQKQSVVQEPRKRTRNPTTKAQPRKKDKLDSYWKALPPHHTLLVQNIAYDGDIQAKLEEVFDDHEGLANVRVIAVRKLAFVEFDSVKWATESLERVDLNQLRGVFGEALILSYAKR